MKVIIFYSILFLANPCFGQIKFNNPSLEGTPTSNGDCVPPGWEICSLTPDIQPINFGCNWCSIASFDGNTYEGMGSFNQNNVYEAFGQEISNCLVPNKLHSFTCHLYSVFNTNNFVLGRLQVWAGNSLCSKSELLWQSNFIDSLWETDTVTFIPTQSYSYITFVGITGDSIDNLSYVGIDALSVITVEGYNFFSFPNSDTTINKGSGIYLNASSDDTNVNYFWITALGDSVSVNDTVTVYPNGTTTYICTATLGCGQQFRDSVTVTVLGGGSGTPQIIIPNLLSAETPVWQIINAQSNASVTLYNTLGQLVYRRSEYKNNLNINELAAATYFYEVKYGSNTYRGKLMVIR